MTDSELQPLLNADQAELMALIGVAAAPVSLDPRELLDTGRNGAFYSSPPAVLGSGATFEHAGLQSVARRFFARWGSELSAVVCGKEGDFAEARRAGTSTLVAALVTALSTKIPELAPYTSLLTLIAVLAVQSGFSAFCSEVVAAP